MVTPLLTFVCILLSFATCATGGYEFLGGASHTAIKFEMYKNLIVIPARINDSISVKLILDTGTRSMLLYGPRFATMHNLSGGRRLKVTGWGSPEGVDAQVSFPNKIRIGRIKGEELALAVVSNRRLFKEEPGIDGIIGYELFVKFVVEIDYRRRTIHLFERLPYGHAEGFTSVPLEINRAMPQVQSSITLRDNTQVKMRLLIDTGSSLGLTVFSKDKFSVQSSDVAKPIGFGLNGIVRGFDLYMKHFFLGNLKVKSVPSYVVNVDEHPDENFTYCGSVGAAFLKKHIVIFDYPSSKLFLLSYKAAKNAAKNVTSKAVRTVVLPS